MSKVPTRFRGSKAVKNLRNKVNTTGKVTDQELKFVNEEDEKLGICATIESIESILKQWAKSDKIVPLTDGFVDCE